MRFLLWAGIAVWLAAAPVARSQGAAAPVITAPTAGQTLQGQIVVMGTTDVPNFASAEMDLAYASDQTGTWFLLETLSTPVANAPIATWDTRSISDGDYVLRLRVTLQDGSAQDAAVQVSIRNEAPTPTIRAPAAPTSTTTPTLTPRPTPPELTALPASPTASAVPFSTPTELPLNPAAVQAAQIYAGIQRGALVIVGLFVVFGILIRLRRA